MIKYGIYSLYIYIYIYIVKVGIGIKKVNKPTIIHKNNETNDKFYRISYVYGNG